MARGRAALPAPTPERVARIPTVAARGSSVARATWRTRPHPWWFSGRDPVPSPETGRFDREVPRGTCYFATDPIAALIGKLSDPDELDPLVSRETLARLVVWHGPLPVAATVADTTHRASRLPKELGTITPYDRCWAWADALDDADLDGLMWWLRFDPGDGRGVAIFGPASTPDDPPDTDAWPDLEHRDDALDFAEALADSFDIVAPTPTLGELDLAPDP